MKKHLSALMVVLAFSLAACSDDSSNSAQDEAPAQSDSEATAPAEVETEVQVQEKQMQAPAATSQPTARDTEQVTNEACLAAVSNETGQGDVAVLSNEFSEANTVVMIGVGANRAPWKCLVSSSGKVAEVMFAGTEGGSVSEPATTQPAASSSSGVPDVAIGACLAAVTETTNEPDVTVLSSEFSEANSLVMVGVGSNRAPWRCLVSNSGQVAEVLFAGAEGGSVSEQAPTSSNVPSDLTNFVGAKGGQAEGGLANLGYELVGTQGLTAFWWNAASGTCARIVTADGRYQSIDMVASADCGQ